LYFLKPNYKLRTKLCDILGIEFPIIEAPIARSSKLVAAVSNAGGLGVLPVTWSEDDEIKEEISKIKKLTDKPFGVNLVLHWPAEEKLKVCLDEGVPIVSFFWGDPSPYIKTAHEAGAVVLSTVASASEGREVSNSGVDVVVAQGWEAGGHVWGTVATMPLIPRVVDAVHPKPVVAAGGIGDGRGIAAALMLGASGVWMGTRFVACKESPFHETYKERILKAEETDTEYTTLFDMYWEDAPHRVLRNKAIESWEKAGRPPRGKRPREGDRAATVISNGEQISYYETTPPYAGMEGDVENLALYAGQSAGLVSDLLTAEEIISVLVDQAGKVMKIETARLTPSKEL
jgi:NAD(P)H-dependent flavin oxidoreductase YrpB (nitropropane dioxygenase family)